VENVIRNPRLNSASCLNSPKSKKSAARLIRSAEPVENRRLLICEEAIFLLRQISVKALWAAESPHAGATAKNLFLLRDSQTRMGASGHAGPRRLRSRDTPVLQPLMSS